MTDASPNLYAALEIDRSAGVAEVRRAYRKAAKRAHPDSGGSRDKFALVKLAADTLGDAGRREKYDRDGTIEDAGPDNFEIAAKNQAMVALLAAIAETEAQGALLRSPLIALAVEKVSAGLRQGDEQTRLGRNFVQTRRDVAKRFRAKEGKENVISKMIEAEVDKAQRQIDANLEQRKILVRAIEILKDHDFEAVMDQMQFVTVRYYGAATTSLREAPS
jgi:curved DNA-binding protein CbpA